MLDNEQHDKSQMDPCFPNGERSVVRPIKCLMSNMALAAVCLSKGLS